MNSLQTCPICKLAINDEAEQCPRCGWDLVPSFEAPEELQARGAEARRRWDERLEEALARLVRHEEELKRREEEIRQKEGELRQLKEALARRAEETSRLRQTLAPKAIAATLEPRANSIGMEFVLIPAGEFLMGSPDSDSEVGDDEIPQHKVTISRPFYLGKYEATQSQWEAVMGSNPSCFKGQSNPVEQVSCEDVQEFIKKLNQMEGTNKYRLPTEAEWEYAARAGTTSAYSFGDEAGALGRYAWHWDNSGETTHPVGQKEPNGWGLYDMHGNVWEWVQDWYGGYSSSPATDPRGPFSSPYRVFRGGGWLSCAGGCRSAYRGCGTPDRSRSIGFRLAFFPGQ
ncbi:MAG: formylglycine-generating enzyme family protein [Candidatus Adiutrix sp.]|nr:formylglycine-generating enzyme family protein [Candidatus Adiutrix sp.]